MMDKNQIARLKELAERATQGSWIAEENDYCYDYVWRKMQMISNDSDILAVMEPLENAANDAAYIAAANPTVVLALIEKIERLEKENGELLDCKKVLNDPQALTVSYFAGAMAEGRKMNGEMDKLLEENRRLEKEADWLAEAATDMDRQLCEGYACPYTHVSWREAARKAAEEQCR
ncbi:MAG: hypothetical protein HDQ91_05495 [Desulfovibrio sp.]|nr:hypothetical protein [Desulfovibrio sp.]